MRAKFVEQHLNTVADDSEKPNWSSAKDLIVYEKTARSCVHENIKYKCYTLKNPHLMNKEKMRRKKDKAVKLLCKPNCPMCTRQLIIFYDKMNF